jgi:hypothetical protein
LYKDIALIDWSLECLSPALGMYRPFLRVLNLLKKVLTTLPGLAWPRIHLFNDCIARLALTELKRSGARFTWSNKQVNPVRSMLDRVFISPEWETHFPMATLSVETRIGSDHTPLILDSGEGLLRRSNRFFFETSWLACLSLRRCFMGFGTSC